MTVEEVIKAYEERFGGYPAFLLMGADDAVIIEKLSRCLEEDEELEPDDDAFIY